jgi:hypothetical protein
MYLIETIHHLSQIMTPTSSPQDHALKSLCYQGAEDGFGQGMVHSQRKINKSTAKVAVLWSGTKGMAGNTSVWIACSCAAFSAAATIKLSANQVSKSTGK